MEEKIMVDMLTQDTVSIKTQRYMVEDGTELEIGLPHRKAYSNSPQGRAALANELAEPYLSAVMTVWGDAPTQEDPTYTV